MRIAFFVVVVLGWFGSSLAGSYFPLQSGSSWEYVGDNGGSSTARIRGFQMVVGSNTVIREWVRYSVTSQESLVNYWSEPGEGDVYLHGFTYFPTGFQWIYDPPILFLDTPLFLGKTWQTRTVVYEDFGGTIPTGDTLTVTFEVSSAGERTVPAGRWFGFAIRETVTSPSESVSASPVMARFANVGGIAKRASTSLFEDWVVENVGVIEVQTDEVFLLKAMSIRVAVEAVSWTSVKALYR